MRETLIEVKKSDIGPSEISILNGEVVIPKRYLRERVRLEKDSILIVSGSLIEGVGTIHSDIDCIVLCNERPKADDLKSCEHALVTDINYHYLTENEEVHNTTDFYGESGLHIDTDYITFLEVTSIVSKIERAFNDIQSDQRFLYSPVLLERENNVIHRSLTGFALVEEEKFEALKKSIPRDKHIYVAHREKLPVFYAFQDVQGCWESGNLWMGCEITREMMLKTTMSFSYLTGITNKHHKWVYSNVFRIHGYDELKYSFFELSRRGAVTETECRKYIVDALDYMDKVFIAIQGLLTQNPVYPSFEKSLAALNYEFNRRKQTEHKISTCEYYFRKKFFAAEDTPALTVLLKEWS
ncbi:hypothetical protein [Pseudomonas fulva]|uniref:hypothetical protein n=1 Tax=Pseudomonas fulva TaxID=47880 RepID=UPI000D900861|nr:hypothetical protein [Pseudomonas fulva]PYB84550.1 hypothetical protein DMX01_21085 [Pseudomonas fulva]PYC09506.1 hypothetical protein DMX00_21165 [Pseudomonas fulva]